MHYHWKYILEYEINYIFTQYHQNDIWETIMHRIQCPVSPLEQAINKVINSELHTKLIANDTYREPHDYKSG